MDMRVVTLKQKQHLTGLLELVCQLLELTPAQIQQATERYEAVGKYLATGASAYLQDASIFAQGSVRLGTTTRPLTREEFDVDLICYLMRSAQLCPSQALEIVGARLRENDTYRRMLEPLKRGWRLNYANEFHLDITPAIPDPGCAGGLLVPDRTITRGKPSHPVGHAEWFDAIAQKQPRILALESRGLARADVETLPEFGRFKGALRRCVQIYKRHRDVMFVDESAAVKKTAPISAVVTTLAAHAYRDGLAERQYESDLDVLQDVLRRMPAYIQQQPVLDGAMKYQIPNPANPNENFAEKWNVHPERAKGFALWHQRAVQDVFQLTQQEGLDQTVKALEKVAGSRTAQAALSEHTERLSKARQGGQLRYSSVAGLAAAPAVAGATVRANTFFGAK